MSFSTENVSRDAGFEGCGLVPRERHHLHVTASVFEQNLCGGSGRGTGSDDVIDENHPFAVDCGGTGGGNSECPAQITPAFRTVKFCLGPGALYPFEDTGCQGDTGNAGKEPPREPFSLVVSPFPEPLPVERYRDHDRTGIVGHVHVAAAEPADIFGETAFPLIFDLVHDRTGGVVIVDKRSDTGKWMVPCHITGTGAKGTVLTAPGAAVTIDDERAEGRVAGSAEPPVIIGAGGIADDTERRKNKVINPPQQSTERFTSRPRHPKRILRLDAPRAA